MEWSYCEGINGGGYFAEIECLDSNRENCRLVIGYQSMREREGYVWKTGPIAKLRPDLQKCKDVLNAALYTFLDGVIDGLRIRDQEMLKEAIDNMVAEELEASADTFGAF